MLKDITSYICALLSYAWKVSCKTTGFGVPVLIGMAISWRVAWLEVTTGADIGAMEELLTSFLHALPYFLGVFVFCFTLSTVFIAPFKLWKQYKPDKLKDLPIRINGRQSGSSAAGGSRIVDIVHQFAEPTEILVEIQMHSWFKPFDGATVGNEYPLQKGVLILGLSSPKSLKILGWESDNESQTSTYSYGSDGREYQHIANLSSDLIVDFKHPKAAHMEGLEIRVLFYKSGYKPKYYSFWFSSAYPAGVFHQRPDEWMDLETKFYTNFGT